MMVKRNGLARGAASGRLSARRGRRNTSPGQRYFRTVTSHPAALSTAQAAPARCLVVDDDAQVRRALLRVVEGHGIRCVEAASGAEALEVLQREGELPLCISDIYMPEVD